jgi:hypothetical protein
LNQSWTLEKTTNDSGKTNYKLITSDSKSSSRHGKKPKKSVQNHKSIAAYGVPSADAYLNNKAQTLNSSIIKSIKKTAIKKEPHDPTNVDSLEDQSYHLNIERFAESRGQIFQHGIISNDTILPYQDENDLLKKSFIYGHLIKENSIINNIHILLSYFGKEKINLTLSIWSLNFVPQMELVKITSIPFNNLSPNIGKFIKKELNSKMIQKGQLFLTIDSDSKYSGDLVIKYSIHLEQVNAQNHNDVSFEFPDFFHLNHKEVIIQNPIPIPEITPIQNNASIFGDFIVKKTEDDIPIFGKKKNRTDDASTNSTYARQSKSAALNTIPEVLDDVSERDNTDINNILNILRNQS